jgi:hypothetical protein
VKAPVIVDAPVESTPARPQAPDVALAEARHSHPEAVAQTSWGWLPALSLVAALGLLIVARAYNAGRDGVAWALPFYWVGMLIMFLPVAARLLLPNVARTERIGLVCLLGLDLYLAAVMISPVQFTGHDDLVHWRTAISILRSGRLFSESSIIPVSPLFPGLEIVTSAGVQLSGLDVFPVALLVVAVARQVMVLALYLLFEQVSGSPQAAGLGVLVYMSNPGFMFFDASFAYESLALSLAMAALLAVARRARRSKDGGLGWTLLQVLAIGATVITHHLTSYALSVFLCLWTLTAWFTKRRYGRRASVAGPAGTDSTQAGQPRAEAMAPGPGGAAALAVIASSTWLVYVAARTLAYLEPVVGPAVLELLRLIQGEAVGRQLFRAATGQTPPWWEPLLGYASAGLIMLGLPFGLLSVWQRYRRDALALALSVAALGYPAGQLLRLTWSGAETASRTSEFVFFGLGFILALAALRLGLTGRRLNWRNGALLCALAVLFVGGQVVGTPDWARLPGPYLVSADHRSVEPEGITAGQWAYRYLGRNHPVAADRINQLLMLSYGQQHAVTGSQVADIFTAPDLGEAVQRVIARLQVAFIVADTRLTTGLPWTGTYYDNAEKGAYQHTRPIDPAALAKFDRLAGISRLFDSGHIRVYDVRPISHAQ